MVPHYAENGLRCAVSDHWRYGGAGAEYWPARSWKLATSLQH